jgi:hypothetical protein
MKLRTSLIPLIGILIFFILYAYAASLYPGGSQVFPQQEGFDWFHNYWCDLLHPTAINGQVNQAQNIALFALLLLCVSLAVLFYLFPKHFPVGSNSSIGWSNFTAIGGVTAMVLTPLISTKWHNFAIGGASFLGFLAIIGIIISFKNYKMKQFLFWGGIAIILLVVNNIMFFARWGVYYLPFLQKLGFFFVLAWFGFISWKMSSNNKIKLGIE